MSTAPRTITGAQLHKLQHSIKAHTGKKCFSNSRKWKILTVLMSIVKANSSTLVKTGHYYTGLFQELVLLLAKESEMAVMSGIQHLNSARKPAMGEYQQVLFEHHHSAGPVWHFHPVMRQSLAEGSSFCESRVGLARHTDRGSRRTPAPLQPFLGPSWLPSPGNFTSLWLLQHFHSRYSF